MLMERLFLIMFENSVITEAYKVKVKIEGFLKTVIYYPHQKDKLLISSEDLQNRKLSLLALL